MLIQDQIWEVKKGEVMDISQELHRWVTVTIIVCKRIRSCSNSGDGLGEQLSLCWV